MRVTRGRSDIQSGILRFFFFFVFEMREGRLRGRTVGVFVSEGFESSVPGSDATVIERDACLEERRDTTGVDGGVETINPSLFFFFFFFVLDVAETSMNGNLSVKFRLFGVSDDVCFAVALDATRPRTEERDG